MPVAASTGLPCARMQPPRPFLSWPATRRWKGNELANERRTQLPHLRGLVMKITRRFVHCWADRYDEFQRRQDPKDAEVEREIETWLRRLPEPKYLDKPNFVKIGRWKTKRQTRAYESNDQVLVEKATRLAYLADEPHLKLHILQVLRGVSVGVSSTILYFLHPDSFPIFDIRARTTLRAAGSWNRPVDDASADAWLEYVQLMRGLSRDLGVSLRDLDKALWAYDRLGGSG